VARRGGRVLDTAERPAPVHPVVERGLREHFAPLFYPEAALAFAGNPAIEHHVRRNAWAPAQAGADPERELGDARLRAVLRGLFDPVRADYAATARALAVDSRAGLLPDPATLARRLPGAYLPDVEAAFDDLASRGMLVQGPAPAPWSPGPRAGDLPGYAAACEAFGLDDEEEGTCSLGW
jgi:hypothetical protein